MRKFFCLLALLIPLFNYGQIQIGSNQVATANRAGKIKAEQLAELKRTTTLFTLQYKDYQHLEAYQKAIESVWTITPFKIIRPDEINNYLDQDGFSFFSFGGFMTTRRGTTTDMSNMHLAYDLWMLSGKKKSNYFARILIYPDNKTLYTAMANTTRRSDDFSSRMVSFVYNDAILYNWGPGLLKGYIKKVNDHLLANDERGPYSEETDKQSLAALKTDTLYVPDYVYIKFSMFGGAEKMDEEKDEEYAAKAYPYPLKIVSTEELDHMILNRKEPFKYLVYVKSSTDKYINVYESTGSLLYARYTPLSYNFKNKDLGKLAKAIH